MCRWQDRTFFTAPLFHLCIVGVYIQRIVQCFLRELLADAGTVRHFIAAVDRFDVIIFSEITHSLFDCAFMYLVNEEIRNDRLDLERCGCRDRAAADMDLNGNIIDICHVTDLLGFRDTAAEGKIRLRNLDHMFLEEFAEIPAGIKPLTGRQRNMGKSLMDLQHVLCVQSMTGLPMDKIVKPAVPFIAVLILSLILVSFFPALSTWLLTVLG